MSRARRASRGEAAPVEVPPAMVLNAYQERVLLVPECFDLALVGSRGPGKTWALVALAVRHLVQYGATARVLFVRQSFPGLVDIASTLLEVLPRAFEGASYNSQIHLWRMPTGGTVELGILESAADLVRYQGRNFTLLLADEATEWTEFSLVDRLRACLRGPAGMPLRLALAGNPGGAGHQGLARRFVLGREPWAPFVDESTGREFLTCPGSFRENPFLDVVAYERQLRAATAGDPVLGEAWVEGNWAIARGAYFAAVIDEPRVAVASWAGEPWRRWVEGQPDVYVNRRRVAWSPDLYLSHDFGSAAPSVTFVCWRSDGREGPDGRFYPAGSVVLLDELATNEPDSLTRGMGYTVPVLAEQLRDLAAAWDFAPWGVADDAIFAKTGSGAGSIAEEFEREGVHFEPARKSDRRTGWEVMRRMLADAGRPDVPGLYVSRACAYWWQTVPCLPRDPKRPDDVDTRGADHAADACRYGLLADLSPSGDSLPTYGVIGS